MPYSRRTARSRPFSSAPIKYDPRQVGPIGMPSTETMFVDLPSITVCSVRWFSDGVVPATSLAYSGAARTATTISAEQRPEHQRAAVTA